MHAGRRAVAETCMSGATTAHLTFLADLWRSGLTALLVVILGLNLAEPGVIQRLVKRNTLLRFLDQKAEDQVLALLRVVRPLGRVKNNSVLAGHPDCLLLRVVIERQRTAEKSVNDAAERPQVTREGVRFLLQNLRCDIAQGTKWLSSALVRANHFGKTKIDKFRHRIISGIRHHDIFKL